MKEFTADPTSITKASVAVLHNAKNQNPVKHYGAFIGLDVHKESIVVAIARPGREPGEYHKEVSPERAMLMRGAYWLSPPGAIVSPRARPCT